ncbi:hypothetical protein TeGR_g3128 [Tetraparma gracilis]|uniref:Uncharacterized protein n=1 Tax=Tetraparma gracilis TaxID=2962635 RepID=A0ABQ6MQH9_9STRA|nr:hypothetical protein TeGR_g3128 [Tetraparma gracilis]
MPPLLALLSSHLPSLIRPEPLCTILTSYTHSLASLLLPAHHEATHLLASRHLPSLLSLLPSLPSLLPSLTAPPFQLLSPLLSPPAHAREASSRLLLLLISNQGSDPSPLRLHLVSSPLLLAAAELVLGHHPDNVAAAVKLLRSDPDKTPVPASPYYDRSHSVPPLPLPDACDSPLRGLGGGEIRELLGGLNLNARLRMALEEDDAKEEVPVVPEKVPVVPVEVPVPVLEEANQTLDQTPDYIPDPSPPPAAVTFEEPPQDVPAEDEEAQDNVEEVVEKPRRTVASKPKKKKTVRPKSASSLSALKSIAKTFKPKLQMQAKLSAPPPTPPAPAALMAAASTPTTNATHLAFSAPAPSSRARAPTLGRAPATPEERRMKRWRKEWRANPDAVLRDIFASHATDAPEPAPEAGAPASRTMRKTAQATGAVFGQAFKARPAPRPRAATALSMGARVGAGFRAGARGGAGGGAGRRGGKKKHVFVPSPGFDMDAVDFDLDNPLAGVIAGADFTFKILKRKSKRLGLTKVDSFFKAKPADKSQSFSRQIMGFATATG